MPRWRVVALTLLGLACVGELTLACTGVRLRAKDGAVLFGRTMEWGSFDLRSRVVIVPRGLPFQSHLDGGKMGLAWTTKFGAVGLDALDKDYLVDGMNEKGMTVNVFYHPGFAEYPPFDPAKVERSVGCLDLCKFLLTTCSTVGEVRQTLETTPVVGVVEAAIGIVAPIHLMVNDPTGKSIVVEFTKGKTTIHEAPLGVITNAPNYDWHMINLRNYVNLSPVALPMRRVEDLNFAPLGGGSGMIGLPGDFTPPSRFVRATAFSATARATADGPETFYELFRILDNFNLPLGSAEGHGSDQTRGMRAATLWTTAYDTKNLVFEYHTMHNRRVRRIDLNKVDFGGKAVAVMPLDKVKSEDVDDVTPARP